MSFTPPRTPTQIILSIFNVGCSQRDELFILSRWKHARGYIFCKIRLYYSQNNQKKLTWNNFFCFQQMPGHQLMLKRIIQLEQSTSQTYKYSTHIQILDSFAIMPRLFCTDILVEKVLPVLDTRLNSRALPVRLTSVKSILVILRKIPKSNVRFYYFNRLLGKSYFFISRKLCF